MSQSGRSRDEDFLTALRADIVRAVCRGTGMQEPDAMPVAGEVIESITERFQGAVYISRPRPTDAEIVAAFDGRNRKEVCRRYRISKGTFYRVLRRSRIHQESGT